MQISLNPELDAFLEAQLASGRFNSVEQMVAEALHLLKDQEELRARELAHFQEEIQQRIDSLDRGEGIPGEELESYFREKSANRRKRAA